MDDSKEIQEIPQEPWLLISDDMFNLQDWLKSANPDICTVNVRTSDQTSIIEVRNKESESKKGLVFQTDILVSPSGHVLGIKQTDEETDHKGIRATILGEKIITYQFVRNARTSNNRSPFSQGQPFFIVCYKDKMDLSHTPRPPWMELIVYSTMATGPDDVQVEYDFDDREGAYTPYTSFTNGLYKIYNGVKSHKNEPFVGYYKPIPHDLISETSDRLIASWLSEDEKFKITVEAPRALKREDVLRMEQILNTETDWMNLPREIPVISYSMSSNQLPEK